MENKRQTKLTPYQALFALSLLFTTLCNGLIICAEQPHDNLHENTESFIQEIDQLLAKIPSEKLQETIIIQEKRRIIEAFISAMNEQKKTTEKIDKKDDAHFFQPKYPYQLTENEKQLSVTQRIKQKYIGQIPGQIEDLIFYFSHHQECIENNIDIFNRVLLHGKPGTGKSHLFTTVAHALQIPYLSFSASFFADKYIGESSRRIRKAFDATKKLNSPILVFIDEIDALATQRKENTHDEHRATLITLLTELQELQSNKNVFIIAATNDIDALDKAIKDRFAGCIAEIKELTKAERSALFQKIFKERKYTIDQAFADRLANVTQYPLSNSEKFSNRDIEYIVAATLFKKFADCRQNKGNCDKHLCSYARIAIDATGKKASFSHFFHDYCDGI